MVLMLHCAVQAAYTKYLECLRLMSNMLYFDACQYGTDKSYTESKFVYYF